MTIGIVCCGPRAGLAVFRALAAIEQVATGAIGGFAVFAAIGSDSKLHMAETQRGGSRTLFTESEHTGTGPPPLAIEATVAGVISSGPDRPKPLSQFLVADPDVGLVSGHRLPNTPGPDGVPLNAMALAAMRAGQAPEAAVRGVLGSLPEADAGLIAADMTGRLFAANTDRVGRRIDVAAAALDKQSEGAAVSVLHNAIGPGASIARLAAETAMAVMTPVTPDGSIIVAAGVPVVLGDTMEIEVDDIGRALRIVTTDPWLASGAANGAAIYLGARIVRAGQVIGHVADEPNCTIMDGVLTDLSGQARCEVGYHMV